MFKRYSRLLRCYGPGGRGYLSWEEEVEWYCVMVRSGGEAGFREQVHKGFAGVGIEGKVHFFQRRLRKGKGEYYDAALFPGYVFLEVERLSAPVIGVVRAGKEFFRLLPSTAQPQAIRGAALEELKLFMEHGGYLGVSRVIFLPGRKIRAVSGPMVGLEGNVWKVNKKKKQITVISSLSPDGKKFDLLYEEAQLLEG